MSLPRAWGQKPNQKSHSSQANKKFELQCGISTFFCMFVYACATYSTARDLLTPPHASWLLPTWLDWWLRVIREAIPPSNTQHHHNPFLGCFAIAAPSAWRHCSTSENIWLFRSSSCATRFRSQATSRREACCKAPNMWWNDPIGGFGVERKSLIQFLQWYQISTVNHVTTRSLPGKNSLPPSLPWDSRYTAFPSSHLLEAVAVAPRHCGKSPPYRTNACSARTSAF